MKKLVALALALLFVFALLPAAGADDWTDLDLYLSIIEADLNNNDYGSTVTIVRVGRLVFAAWSDEGCGVGAERIKRTPSVLAKWPAARDGYVDIQQNMQENISADTGLDVVVVFNLVDDRDGKTVLLSIAEGEILYDAIGEVYGYIPVE